MDLRIGRATASQAYSICKTIIVKNLPYL
jgi:hypothetical protein